LGGSSARPASPSDFKLLGQLQGVIDLYAEISHSALQLTVAELQLAGPQIAGLLVD
jgi:hypothetical protein